MKVQAIQHVSLIVTDLDRSRHFYEEILGLIPNPARPDKAFAGIWYDAGPQQIHLIVSPSGHRQESTGYGGMDYHVALAVDSLPALVDALQKSDIPFTPSRSGRSVVFCRDPDGNAFELVGSTPP